MLDTARLPASQPYRPTVRIRRAHKPPRQPLLVQPAGHRGARLRAWRLRLGLTQPAIGQRAGIAARTVSWIEHHGRGPSVERLRRALETIEWERCR